jgi:hypothetical protein
MNAKPPTHVYISGPMRGYQAFNFPAFFEAEAHLRELWPDADFCNPAREDIVRQGLTDTLHVDPTGLTAGLYLHTHPSSFTETDLRAALCKDFEYVTLHCDLVVVLPGWEKSKGALAEVAAAEAVGIPVLKLDIGLNADEPVHPTQNERVHAFLTDPKPVQFEHSPQYEENEPLPSEVPWLDPKVAEEVASVLSNDAAEVRVTSPTGGQKGVKLAAFDQVSPEVEWLIAEHFGKGARKYAAHNFRKGYSWSRSYSALRRHLAEFWAGKDYDEHQDWCKPDCNEHTGSLHIVAVAWHAMVLTEFFLHHKEYDDRFRYADE